jgi:hypothetical protein
MALFKRKPKYPTVEAPDGTAYVVVPEADSQPIAEHCARRTIELHAEPLPKVPDTALATTYEQVLHPDADGDADQEHQRMCWQAARLGWALRFAEFEDSGGEPDQPHLTAFMTQVQRDKTFGEEWFAAVMGSAATLWNAARKDPYRPDVAELLGPVGFGHDVRKQTTTMLVGCIDPDRQPFPDGVVVDLYESIRFGYWYRACFVALPDMVRDMVFLVE